MERDTFLSRVRVAARAGVAYRVHVDELPPDTGYVGAPDDLVGAMAWEVEQVGGVARRVADENEARAALRGLLREHQIRAAICWRHPLLERLGLADLLAEAGVAWDDHDSLRAMPAAQQRERILSADIGITSADIAIAETGSLMVWAGPGHERVTSLVPPIHVAVIERSQIVPDLFDAFARLTPASLPSNVALITGPSKTGDIELQLTTGVHGPGTWYVLLIDK